MRIVEPEAHLFTVPNRDVGIGLLKFAEFLGRISHRSEGKQDNQSWERFIKAVVLNHGDWSIMEHANATVIATVDRGITHEWVRHRIGAYTQESTRFVNYEKHAEGLRFIAPDFDDEEALSNWRVAMRASEAKYLDLLETQSPQIARSVLPNSLASTIAVTYNLRNWRHFFLMRTTKETHPQFKKVTIPLLEEFKARIPLLYDDIEPDTKQSIAMSKVR